MILRISLCSMLVALAAAADGWPLPGAVWRWSLTRQAEDEGRVRVGHVRIWPQDQTNREVAVFEGNRRLGHSILWCGPGEPIDLLFQTAGDADRYQVYLGEDLGEPPDWQPRAGLVVESRRLIGEVDVDASESIQAAWERGEVEGRSLVAQIFQGFNPHGPSQRCLLRFDGWLRIRNPGRYRFATVSDDASICRLDGEELVSWLGWHGPQDGLRGRYDGHRELRPGLHRLDYLLVQGGGGMCAELAWEPPGAEQLRLLEVEAFEPTGRFEAIGLRHRSHGEQPMLTWEPLVHAISGEHCLVAMGFDSVPPSKGLRWHLDDGATIRGAKGRHVFLRGGLRAVRVLLPGGDERQLQINVRRAWHERVEWSDQRGGKLWGAALDRDLGHLPIAELLAAIDWAEHLADDDARHRLADALLARLDEVPEAEEGAVRSVYALAFSLQDQHLRRFRDAASILAALAGWPVTPPRLRAQARLHMAGNLIHHLDSTATAEEILQDLAVEQLDEGERRLRQIFLADAALYRRRPDLARDRYAAAGTVVEVGDLHYAARRRARLEAAKDYLRRDEFDAAERIVHEIQWETPLERLGSECTLLLNRIRLARGDHRTARLHLEAFLANVEEDPRESELLLLLVRASLAEGAQQLAARTAERLRRDHPYSEAAVRVADLIGVQP